MSFTRAVCSSIPTRASSAIQYRLCNRATLVGKHWQHSEGSCTSLAKLTIILVSAQNLLLSSSCCLKIPNKKWHLKTLHNCKYHKFKYYGPDRVHTKLSIKWVKTLMSLGRIERGACRFRFSADRDQYNSTDCNRAILVQDLALNILVKDSISI